VPQVIARTRLLTSAFALSVGLAVSWGRSAAAAGERRDGYAISIEAHQHYATRRDFTRPVFLFQTPVEEIRAQELALELRLELELLWKLWLELELPIVYERAAVRYAPAQISPGESSPATWRELSGAGLAAPALALRYRFFEAQQFGGALALGARIPADDNPGGGVLPERLPLSTGQREWFLEVSLAAALESLRVELLYHVGYHPGDAASYLVRRVGSNQIASGVLGDFVTHRLKLGLVLFPQAQFSLALAPTFSLEENPPLLEGGKELAFLKERTRRELGLELRVGARLSSSHRLELFYEHVFLDAWQKDPFFPIVVPERGFGVAWRIAGP
jgi:hypothetical protein